MKKTTMTLLLLLSAAVTMVNAQPGGGKGEKKEKLEALRVAFITKELNLTPEEAEKFWPLYNQREAEQEAVRKELRDQVKGKNIDEMTDAEVEKLIEKQLELRQKELDIDKKYAAKLKEVLPVKKVAKLPQAEKKFREEVIQQWKDNHQKPGGGKGPNHTEMD
ncbi:MAG: Spy/CpxP family protein refolding chaperone [Bacteroidota bacterium]